ncbi:MAG: hypothetical protein QNJ68_10310 [Microcoleaceae cyanobacterium MO_207.B10]|nr:hypothetical protein [Microcoleaceae cyanobacterium MO_207.B10]
MIYLKIFNEENALEISRKLWELTSPKTANSATQYYCDYTVIDSKTYLVLGEDLIYIHPESNEHLFDELLLRLINSELIPFSVLFDTQQAIVLNKGSRVRFADVFPDIFPQFSQEEINSILEADILNINE